MPCVSMKCAQVATARWNRLPMNWPPRCVCASERNLMTSPAATSTSSPCPRPSTAPGARTSSADQGQRSDRQRLKPGTSSSTNPRLPGLHEEVCVRSWKNSSGLKFNQDFFCGYSPERINPGDKQHASPTSSSHVRFDVDTADVIDALTRASSPPAPTRPADQGRRSAKVIENTSATSTLPWSTTSPSCSTS